MLILGTSLFRAPVSGSKKEIDPIVWEIIKNHFDDFANHKYKEIISNILSLISCSKSYLKIRSNAIMTWQKCNTYAEDIISALDFISQSVE